MSRGIIIGREGTQAIPITDRTVSRRHCELEPQGDGSFILTNLSRGVTKVDGVDIIKKRVYPDTVIELGPRFRASVAQLLNLPQHGGYGPSGGGYNQGSGYRHQPPVQEQQPTVNVRHLERIWDDYNMQNLDNARKTKNANLVRTGSMVFSLSSGIVAFLLPELMVMGLVFSGIGVLGVIYGFLVLKNGEDPQETQYRRERFMSYYCCPKCHGSLPVMSYRLLRQNYRACPRCKAKFEY